MATPDRARAVRRILGSAGWSGSVRLRLLDFDVAVFSDDPVVVDLVEELYAPARTTGDPMHVLSLGRAGADRRRRTVVALDGVPIVRTEAPNIAFAHLLFEANQQVIEQTAAVLLHAAAAVRGDRAVVLAGPMGAGKSTLVAGLALQGFGYLTDEVVAIDRVTGAVRPYPKPVSIGIPPSGLGALRWQPPGGGLAYLGGGGLVPAQVLPGGVAEAAPPALVVLPSYEPDAPTAVVPLGPAEALAAVAAHAFHLERPGTLRALAAALRGVPCFRVVGGSLDATVDAMLELADEAAVRA